MPVSQQKDASHSSPAIDDRGDDRGRCAAASVPSFRQKPNIQHQPEIRLTAVQKSKVKD